MSISFTAYFNDSGIAQTSIYASPEGVSYTRAYGASTLNVSGFSGSLKFTATPASGYGFNRWVYRLGSTSGTVQYSYNNPFTYSGSQDIFIRAESVSQGSDWSVTSGTWAAGTGGGTASSSYSIGTYQIRRFSFKPTVSGTLTWYAGSGADTIGWINSSSSWSVDSNGYPLSGYYIGTYTDDASGTAFSATATVTANTTYYLFVCTYNGSAASGITLTTSIEGSGSTWSVTSGTWGRTTTTASVSFAVGHKVYRYSFTPAANGQLTWYASTGADTIGWISSSSTLNVDSNGYPVSGSFLGTRGNATSGYVDDYDGTAFRAGYALTGGVTYYLFVLVYNGGTASSNITLNLSYSSSGYTVTFRHYVGTSLQATTTATLASGTTIALADYATSISGYSYSYAQNTSGTTITTATITAAVTFNLYYASSSGYRLSVYCNGNCYKVSATVNGGTETISSENGSIAVTVPAGATVKVKYYGYTGSSTTWYKFYGWYTGTSASGTCKGYTRELEFTMSAAALTLYGYVVVQYSAFSWTYAKTTGATFNLTADEWNGLWQYIEARKNRYIAHTRASTGLQFTATMYNQAVSGIGAGTTVSRGQRITAALMNALVTNARNI